MRAGLANLPIIVTMIAATPPVEWLAREFGHRIACLVGAAFLAGSLAGLSWGVDRVSLQMTNPRLAHADLLRGIKLR